MPYKENNDYRRYLEEKFTGISGQIKAQNDMQDIRMNQMMTTLDEVLNNVKQTNGRVTRLEGIQSGCPKEQVDINTKAIEEVKFIKKYFKPLVYSVIIGIVGIVLTAIKSFGF